MAAFVVSSILAIAAFDTDFGVPAGFFRKNGHQPGTDVLELGLPQQRRGNIYDRNYRLLAGNLPTRAIYARPMEVVDLGRAAQEIAPLLEIPESELLTTLKSERAFVWIGRNIAQDKAERIGTLGLDGIYLLEEANRTYPLQALGAHVLGFVSKNQGLGGIEFSYDPILRGDRFKGAQGLPWTLRGLAPDTLPDKGGHLVLTLDIESQQTLETALSRLIEKTDAKSGAGLVIAPDTGAILAMASLPGYDPNHFWDFNTRERSNRALSGATFPPFPAGPADPGNSTTLTGTTLHNGKEVPLVVASSRKKRVKRGQRLSLAVANPLFEMGGRLASAGANVDLVDGASLAATSHPGSSSALAEQLAPETATPLQLLCGFITLANKGLSLSPHLLAEVLAPESRRVIEATQAEPLRILDPAAGEKLWQELAAIATPGPDRSLLLEHVAGHSEAGTAHGLLLGLAPAEKPEVAFLYSINFAGSDMASASVLRTELQQAGRRTVPDLLKHNRVARTKLPADIWDNVRLAVGPGHTTEQPSRTVPDQETKTQQTAMPLLKGKSLRCGLQAIQDIGARVKIIGSGTIVEQHPREGALISKGELCILKLETPLAKQS